MNQSSSPSRPGPVRGAIAAYPATSFIAMTFTATTVSVLLQWYEIRNHGLSFLRPFLPALWAIIVAWIAWGKEDARGLVTSLLKWRINWKFYAFALLYPSFVGVLALVILRVVGMVENIHFDFAAAAGFWFFRLSVSISLVEEISWIGFLLVLFSSRYRLFQASVVTGAFWGISYIPLVLAEYQVVPGLPIGPLILNFMTIAAICGWLYARTKSAFVVFVMQVSTNYSSQIIPVLPQRGGMAQYVAFVIMKAVLALTLFLFWGPRPMFGGLPPGKKSSLDLSPESGA